MKEIGMHYEAIHVCPDMECMECHVSRYRTDKVTKKVPQKVLCYIPIIPHL